MNRGWRFCRLGRKGAVVDSSCFLVSAKPSIYPVFGLFWTHVGPKFGWRFFLGLEAGRNGPSFADPPTRRVVVIDFWTTLISVELRHEQTGHGGFRVDRDLESNFSATARATSSRSTGGATAPLRAARAVWRSNVKTSDPRTAPIQLAGTLISPLRTGWRRRLQS